MVRKIFSLFLVSSVIIACSENKITGRNQLKLFNESELQSLAATQYQQFLSSNRVVNSGMNRDAEMVRRAGVRLTRAVTDYYTSKGYANDLVNYRWEYNLIENNAANAWCMPGGKIVVYTGLLPISQNEAALAFVIGHEVAHAVLQHGNERMSQALGAEVVGLGVQVALSNKPAETRNIFYAAYGAGATLGVLLPFSRKHELEADHYGLLWTAMAGYNPREAVGLWQRMENASKGNSPPEFLSTHPSGGRRINELEKYMPEALSLYRPVNN
jgi:predicted Zn-dependent protease